MVCTCSVTRRVDACEIARRLSRIQVAGGLFADDLLDRGHGNGEADAVDDSIVGAVFGDKVTPA